VADDKGRVVARSLTVVTAPAEVEGDLDLAVKLAQAERRAHLAESRLARVIR
jgi:hypothetical protein